jgi:hypothetical protein
MSMQDELRPMTMLNDFMATYGYDKNITTSDEHKSLCYLATETWKDGEWEKRWRLGGIADSPDRALLEAFGEGVVLLKDSHKAELGRHTTKVSAIVLMTHGSGRYAINMTGEPSWWEDIPKEEQDELRQRLLEEGAIEELEAADEGEVPVRVANIITPFGLGAQIAMFRPSKSKPQVEHAEQWTGEHDNPQPSGMVDEALMSSFLFLTVIYDTVRNGGSMNAEGLVENALRNSNEPNGKEMLAFVLKLVANGIESGVLDFGED